MTKGYNDFVDNVVKPIIAAAKNPDYDSKGNRPKPKPKPKGSSWTATGFVPAGIPRPPKSTPKPNPRPVAPRPKPSGNTRPAAPSRPAATSGRPAAPRPATRPTGGSTGTPASSRPKTFTDASGKVRPLAPLSRTVTRSGVKKTSAKKGSAASVKTVDPIEAMVDEIIAGMNQPLTEQKRQLGDQTRGTLDQNARLANTYDQRVNDLRTGGNLDLGASLAKAAELKGLSAETIAKNQEWLMSLMGPDGGGGGIQAAQSDAGDVAANVAGANDDLAREIAGGGQRLNDTLATAQLGNRGMQREFDYQAQLQQRAAGRDLDGQAAANRAKRPEMLYQMRSAAEEAQLKQMVAEQEWGLDKAKIDSLNAYRSAQLGQGDARLQLDAAKAESAALLAAQRISQAGKPKPGKKEAPGRYGNIPARYDKAIDKVYANLTKQGASPEGLKAPWRTAHHALIDNGLNPNTAAILASKWYDSSITSSNPRNILTMLRNRKVSDSVAKLIITNAWGPDGWKQANSKGAIGDAVTSIGNSLDHLTNTLKK